MNPLQVETGELETSMAKFVWKLEEFSDLGSQKEDLIESPRFEMKGFDDTEWHLQLYPYGDEDSDDGFLAVYLHNDSKRNIRNVCFELILSDTDGKLIISEKCYEIIYAGDPHGPTDFIKRDTVLQKINSSLEDTLIVTCIINMDIYSEDEVDLDKKILQNYESLLSNDIFSDVTIKIKERNIKAHKNILSVRSKVFAAMFRRNMREHNITITITDVNYSVMKEFISFIYSGKIKDLKKNVKALLSLADKYEVEELKVLCQKHLWKNLQIRNACDTLLTADLYHCSRLKTQVTAYIIKNIKILNNTSTFKSMNRSNPELFEKVMFAVVDKKLKR